MGYKRSDCTLFWCGIAQTMQWLVRAFPNISMSYITHQLVEFEMKGSSSTYLSLNTLHLNKAKPATARKSKPLVHNVGTKPTFIQLQSWQMVSHSSPTGFNLVWFHASTSIPGPITHPSKRCSYFQHLASWAPRIRRSDCSNGWFGRQEWSTRLGWNTWGHEQWWCWKLWCSVMLENGEESLGDG